MMDYLAYIAILFTLVPIIIGGYKKVYQDSLLRYIWLLLLISLGIDYLTYLMRLNQQSTLLYINIYGLLELGILSYVWYQLFHSSIIQKFIIPTVIGLSIIACLDLFYWSGLNQMNVISLGFNCVFMCLCALLYFKELLNKPEMTQLSSFPFFWIVAGLLFFFAGSFTPFISWNFIHASGQQIFLFVWSLPTIAKIILHIFISIGFWQYAPKSTL